MKVGDLIRLREHLRSRPEFEQYMLVIGHLEDEVWKDILFHNFSVLHYNGHIDGISEPAHEPFTWEIYGV